MHKSATKCNETLGKWCKNKHGASKIMDTFEMYHQPKKARLGATFVNKRSKKDLWRKLMANFILPPEYSKMDDDGNEILGGRERRRRVK
jgi:hypothetical protein